MNYDAQEQIAEFCSAVAPDSVRIVAILAYHVISWKVFLGVALVVVGSVAKAYLRSHRNG